MIRHEVNLPSRIKPPEGPVYKEINNQLIPVEAVKLSAKELGHAWRVFTDQAQPSTAYRIKANSRLPNKIQSVGNVVSLLNASSYESDGSIKN